MAETTTATKTTTPRRTRAAAKPTTTRKTPAAKTAAPAPAATADDPSKFIVELEFVDNTKTYAKFAVPASLKGTMVGSVYAPLGTDRVRVMIIGAEDAEEIEATE